MPVELNIVESTTELDTTVVEVNLVSASEPGPAGPGVPTGGTDGQVLTKTSATDYATAWEDPTGGGGGGAPTDVDYLVGTASGDLSAEIVVGTAPGGELGGTWASPTVDATHSGSSHASVQAAAEATAAAALATHSADTTGVHGIADTSALALTASHPTNATFNDHSARHEDGGADELSIAGLAGIPTELQTHLDDTTAHTAANIPIVDAGNDFTATDVEGALAELQADHETDAQNLADHIADAAAAHAASAISNTAAGNIVATTVQAAIDELDSEKTTAAAALTAAQTEIADQKRVIEILVTDPNGSSITTGDGKAYVAVPALLNGHNLVALLGAVTGQSSSGSVTVQIHNVTQAADMLSGLLTINASTSFSTTATIDAGNDDVATGDILRVDVDSAGTSAEGLIVALTFEAP